MRKESKPFRRNFEEELSQISANYTNHFVQYYNKDELNAFSTIVKYRDESERRVSEILNEIDYEIKKLISEFQNYRDKENSFQILSELKPHLLSLKNKPDLTIINTYKDLVEEYGGDSNNKINQSIIDNAHGLIEELIHKSYTLKKIKIIKGTASLFVNDIIDLGFPLRIDKEKIQYIMRDIDISPPDTKPSKDEIYNWYSIHLSSHDNNAEKAFDALISEILFKGLKVEDYIKTDTPENFNRSYRSWLNKKIKRK